MTESLLILALPTLAAAAGANHAERLHGPECWTDPGGMRFPKGELIGLRHSLLAWAVLIAAGTLIRLQ